MNNTLSLQHQNILLLGNDFLSDYQAYMASEKLFNIHHFEHMPSLCEIQSLDISLIVFNLYEQNLSNCTEMLELACKFHEQFADSVPMVAITNSAVDFSSYKNIFRKIVPYEQTFKKNLESLCTDLNHVIRQAQNNQLIFNSLFRFSSQVREIYKNHKADEARCEPSFHYASAKSNILVSHSYFAKTESPPGTFQVINLSISHQALLMIDINEKESIKNLVIGHIQGIIETLLMAESPILNNPSALLELLFTSLTNYVNIDRLQVSLWYGIFNLASKTLYYAGSQRFKPLCSDQQKQVRTISNSVNNTLISLGDKSKIILTSTNLVKNDEDLELINKLFTQSINENIINNETPLHILTGLANTSLESLRNMQDGSLIVSVEFPVSESYTIQLAEHNTIEQSDLNNLLSKLNISDQSTLKNLELSLGEMTSQVNRLKQYATNLSPLCTDSSQIVVSWWKYQNYIDFSIKLQGNIRPWAYVNNNTLKNNNIQEYLESYHSLALYFDNLRFNYNGMELSCRYSLTL